MQVFHAQVANSISVPAVHINQRFEAILLAAVEEPIDGEFLVDLDVILDEVVQEVVANDFTAGVAFIAESFSHEIEVFF